MADAGETGALQLGVQRLAMVDDMMGPCSRAQAWVSGREAVAITLTFVS